MRRIPTELLWLALLLSVPLALCAQTGHRIAPGPLTVNLTSAADDKPVVGAYVHLGGRYATTTPDGTATFDGVPAGTYTLVVAQDGFDRLEQKLDLPEGRRDPLVLRLSPTVLVTVTGQVTLEGDDRPLAGARISMTPVSVPATTRGRLDLTTDWDGNLTAVHVPAGQYRVDVSAIGCAARTFQVEVAADMQPLALALPAVDEPTELTVTATDALTGAPIPAASVVLAEAWPRGVIGRAVTDGAGRAAFTALATGRLNWEKLDPVAALPALWCDGNNWVRLLTQGDTARGWYFNGFSSVEGQVGDQGRSLTGQWTRRVGPNRQESGRFSVSLSEDGKTIVGRYSIGEEEPGQDWKWYSLTTSTVARGTLAATVMVEAEGYEPTAVPASLGRGAAVAVPLNPSALVSEREPNDDLASAQAIPTGAPVELRIQRPGDHDCFRFRLRHPAMVRVGLSRNDEFWASWQLLRPDGSVIARAGVSGPQQISEEIWLPAGEYLVLVQEWNDSRASEAPLYLRIGCAWAPDAYEPNNSLASARPIHPGQEVRGSIAPIGDADYFRFTVERPSHVRFSSFPHYMWRNLDVLDQEGKELASRGFSGNSGDLTLQLGPGSYCLRIGEWNNSCAFVEPYTLRMELVEDDLVDDTEQAPGAVRAVRTLPLGTQVSNTIFPGGDHDYYRLAIPSAGRLYVTLTRPPAIWCDLALLDETGAVLTEVGVSGEARELAHDLDGPTTLYVRVREWNNNSCSHQPYCLSTRFEACDELEVMGRNDTRDTASPLELGEVVRANIMPSGDDDWYTVTADFPGVLEVSGGMSPLWMVVQVYNAAGQQIHQQFCSNPNGQHRLELPVLAGDYFVRVCEWNDRHASACPYSLQVNLVRAEMAEREPLRDDPVRTLHPGEAQAFWLDQSGDRDRFEFDVVAAGTFRIRMRNPVGLWTTLSLSDDRTGERLREWGNSGGGEAQWQFEAGGPTRYRLEIREWNDKRPSALPGWVLVDTQERGIPAESLSAAADPCDPTLVTFTRAQVEGMARADHVRVDVDADGESELSVPADAPATWRYPAEGLYRAVAWLQSDNGLVSKLPLWVQAYGPRERKGVYAVVDRPSEGQVIETDEPVRVRAMSYTGARIVRVQADVDGVALPTAYTNPCSIEVPWRRLTDGEHVLTVTAFDARGEKATVQRRFRVSEYFDLQPANGATITGNAVRVSWSGGKFGPAQVQFRPKGEQDWQMAVGESGRDRLVLLKDLEAGKPYEIQPLGGGDPGPVRTITRVKGLAFGRSRYGATIARDYDQRVPISVRNHAEQPMKVNLVCGKPATPDLLVSFVGEGSEDRPVDLGPGEEREFLLVFAAQDAIHPTYHLPVRITSDSGFSDEADVEVNVKLPEVKLTWEDLGETQPGLGRRFRLSNAGDGLTDLALSTDTANLSVFPAVEHGIFPPGAAMEVVVRPRLYDGFQSVRGNVVATAVGKQVPQEVRFALQEGQQVYGVWLSPGSEDTTDPVQADLMQARFMAGAYLNPSYVDWTQATNPQDTNGDGQPDRWSLPDVVENVYWVGNDTDGDGRVDFVQGDIGGDGQFDYSGIATENGWEETNLVDAQLEMGFSLRGGPESYQKHDVDLVMNGQLLGQIKDAIPQGNFRFNIPPRAIRFDTLGNAEGNEIEIHSRHLRGGHYAVTSDFRVKMRLTGARAFVVATSEEQAKQQIEGAAGVSLSAPDFSVSSQELRVSAPPEPKMGDPIAVTVPLRNLGAAVGECVPVALVAVYPGGQRKELTRYYYEYVPTAGVTQVSLSAPAPPGKFTLQVVVDPDGQQQDLDPDNNTAMTEMSITGDQGNPTLKVLEPTDGATLTDTVFRVQAQAQDDVRIARTEVRVDGGLWRRLGPEGGDLYAARGLLQPGPHRITVRATDVAGNQVEQTAQVTVDAPTPEVTVLEPADGAVIPERQVTLRARVGNDAALVAARVNGGPWQPLQPRDGLVEAALPLRFGEGTVEVMTVNSRGAQRIISRSISCTRQPEQSEAAPALPLGLDGEQRPGVAAATVSLAAQAPGSGIVQVDGLGPVDMFRGPNDVLEPPAAAGAPGPEPGTESGPVGDEPEEDDSTIPDAPPEPEEPEDAQPVPATLEMSEDDFDEFVAQFAPPPDAAALPTSVAGEPFRLPSWDCPPPERRPDPGTPAGLPGGLQPPAAGTRSVSVQARQCDWYCTNRPNIKVKFQLPDWLKRLNLPKPGSKEYDAMVQKLLAHLRDQGIDTRPLEKFQEVLLRAAGRLQQPDELPGWLESIGFAGPKPTDEAGLKAWRENMQNGVRAWWLRLLSSGDPVLIYQGLQARHQAMGQFDIATQEAAQAAMETIQSYQQETEFWLYSTLAVAGVVGPGLGTSALGWALDIDLGLTALRGETLSGHQLTKWDYALLGLLRFGPVGIQKALQSERAGPYLTAIGNATSWLGTRAQDKLRTVLGPDKAARIGQGLKWLWEALTKERTLRGRQLNVRTTTAAANAGHAAAGIESEARLAARVKEVDKLIRRFMKAKPGKKPELALRIQENPDAVALLKSGKYPPEVVDDVGTVLKGRYDVVDKHTVRGIEKSPEGQAAIKKACEAANGNRELSASIGRELTPNDVGVRPRNITGSKGAKFGDDRDVMFEFFDKQTGKSIGAVDHELAGPIYGQNLKMITGRTPRQLHHEVTSPTHPEAYNLLKYRSPEAQQAFVESILAGEAAGQHGWRGTDLGQTVARKVKDCFAEAAELASRGELAAADAAYTRGMRMALKEYDRHVVGALQARGLSEEAVLSPRLRQFLEQARKVRDGFLKGDYTVEQARAAMESVSCRPQGQGPTVMTFDRAAEDLGALVEIVNRFQPPTKR